MKQDNAEIARVELQRLLIERASGTNPDDRDGFTEIGKILASAGYSPHAVAALYRTCVIEAAQFNHERSGSDCAVVLLEPLEWLLAPFEHPQPARRGRRVNGNGLAARLISAADPNPRDHSCDLNAFLQELAGPMRRVLGSKLSLCLDLDPKLPLIRLDPTRIDGVLLRMVARLRDLMQPSTAIRVETRLDTASGSAIIRLTYPSDAWIQGVRLDSELDPLDLQLSPPPRSRSGAVPNQRQDRSSPL